MIAHPSRSKRPRKPIATATITTIADPALRHDHDQDYAALMAGVQQSFTAALDTGMLLFRTTADPEALWNDYLDALPAERQVHTCSACRHFVHRFGGLLAVAPDGKAGALMWECRPAPEFYEPAITAMWRRIARSSITGPFLSGEAVLGTPETGPWQHLAVKGCPTFSHGLLTPGQAMARKREDHKTVLSALDEFKATEIDEALRLLRGGHLSMSERFIAPLEWLRALYEHRKVAGPQGSRAIWYAVATAPDGYCHPRSAVTGTLLEDIAAGRPFEAVKRSFDEKVAPLAYQRPQAPPSAGNIKAAEAIVEKLGLAPALERRFALVDECEVMWVPKAAEAPKNGRAGVFSHLEMKGAAAVPALDTPAVSMTWRKFSEKVLPQARRIQLFVPALGSFIALTTAANRDAPPILKWDDERERCPFAWYVYPGGSSARQWSLAAGWTDVTGIIPLPPMWRGQPHLGTGVVLALAGACDTRDDSGNALFPACLRNELHEVRSTIEAYSRRAKLSGRDDGVLASGYDFRENHTAGILRIIADSGHVDTYQIDRWD